MTKYDFIKAVSNRLDLYREVGMEDSIQRNRHMNDLDGTEWNQELADKVLDGYLVYMGGNTRCQMGRLPC